MRSPRPDLIFVCADQLRYDALGATGNPVARTPNLDAVAASGMTFHRHHTPNQICSPSRASMATGLLPRHHGLWRNGVALDERLPTLWKALAAAGYATHAVGKLHYQPLLAPARCGMPESLAFWRRAGAEAWTGPYYGFQRVELVLGEANAATEAGHYASWLRAAHPEVVRLYEPDALPGTRAADLREVWTSAVPAALHYTSWIADRAVEAIRSYAGRTPFALFVSFPDPHHPFAPPRPYAGMFDPAAMPPPAVREGELDRMPPYLASGDDPAKDAYIGSGEPVREQGFLLRTDTISARTLQVAAAHTYGMVAMIDDAVGRLRAAVEACGTADGTCTLFTSDHGELLGDHGLLRKGPPPYRQLLQVPLIMAGPGIAPGTHSHALTSHVDLFETLAALLGIAAPFTDGTDLTPVLAGIAPGVRDRLYAEYHPRADARLYNQTVITEGWRYTRYPTMPGWGELFDLSDDPGEHWNLFGEADPMRKTAPLRAALAQDMPPKPNMGHEVLGAY